VAFFKFIFSCTTCFCCTILEFIAPTCFSCVSSLQVKDSKACRFLLFATLGKPGRRNTAFSLISICLRCGAIFQFLTDAQFTSHSMCLQLWAPAIHPTISFTGCISLSLVHRCAGPKGYGAGGGHWTDSLIDEQRRLGQKFAFA